MSDLLKKFQNPDLGRITQTFKDLTGSIASAFEGLRGNHGDAEVFDLRHDGLTIVSARLHLKTQTISLGVSGSCGFDYSDFDPFKKHSNGQSRFDIVDLAGFEALVRSKVNLASKWTVNEGQYGRLSFQIEISELSDVVLKDLVYLIERVGFVPRRAHNTRYF